MLAALGAATDAVRYSSGGPGLPLVNGNYWNVTEVTIDDGHFATMPIISRANYRKQQEFAKSKGWIKAYYILANVNKRADEPDLYLVTIFDHVTTPAEDIAREKEINAYLAQTTAPEAIAGSGERATIGTLAATCCFRS